MRLTVTILYSGKPLAERGADDLNQVENYLKTNVEDVNVLIMDDPREDMVEKTELSKDVLVIKETNLPAASDEGIIANKGTEEKSNVLSDFNKEGVDCDYHKDDPVGDSFIETTETSGCRSDSKQVLLVNSDLEVTQSADRSNVNEDILDTLELSKDESELKETIVDQFLGKSNLSEDISKTMELSRSDLELKGTTVDQLSATLGNGMLLYFGCRVFMHFI